MLQNNLDLIAADFQGDPKFCGKRKRQLFNCYNKLVQNHHKQDGCFFNATLQVNSELRIHTMLELTVIHSEFSTTEVQ